MKKVTSFFSAVLLAILCFSLGTYRVEAHSGKTDGKGGHTNHATGEYHYHHGYPAHDHYDIDGDGKRDCPYEFNGTFGDVLSIIFKIICITFVILVVGFFGWCLVYAVLNSLFSWFCKKILKADVNESAISSVISKTAIFTILVISVMIALLIVLNSEGLL